MVLNTVPDYNTANEISIARVLSGSYSNLHILYNPWNNTIQSLLTFVALPSQAFLSLPNIHQYTFSSNGFHKRKSSMLCSKERADIRSPLGSAKPLTHPPPPRHKSDNVTVACRCALWEIQIQRGNPVLPLPRLSTIASGTDEMYHSGLTTAVR